MYAAGAYTHQGAYTRAGAFTRAVGVYTQRVRIHTRVRIRLYAGRCVYASGGCIYAPGCVYAGRRIYANGGCVYTGGVYTHPLAYTQVSAYTYPRLRIRRNRRTVMCTAIVRSLSHVDHHGVNQAPLRLTPSLRLTRRVTRHATAPHDTNAHPQVSQSNSADSSPSGSACSDSNKLYGIIHQRTAVSAI